MTARDLPPLELQDWVRISDEGTYAELEFDRDRDDWVSLHMDMDGATALRDWLTTWIEARQPMKGDT